MAAPSPVPTGTDCSFVENVKPLLNIVPSLRGRIVLSKGSVRITISQSRPYGDGLFHHRFLRRTTVFVPSLRGRIVLPRGSTPTATGSPVPTGTDCSRMRVGTFSLEKVPSLRGRIVPTTTLYLFTMVCPVPTGTDCSVSTPMSLSKRGSRPYGDGLFLHLDIKKYQSGVPSLRGRIVPFCRCFWTARVGPVPTGTDCSINICATTDDHRSRPYGDGLFRGQQDDLSFYNGPVPTGDGLFFVHAILHYLSIVPSLRGRIVLRRGTF